MAANRAAHDRAAAVQERRNAERRLEHVALLLEGERARWADAGDPLDEPREPAMAKAEVFAQDNPQGEQWARLAAEARVAQLCPGTAGPWEWRRGWRGRPSLGPRR